MARTGRRNDEEPPERKPARPPEPLSDDAAPDRDWVDGGPFPVGATERSEFPDVGENALAPIFPRAMARLTDFVLSVLVPQALMVMAFGVTIETEGEEDALGLPLWGIPVLVLILAVYEIGLVAWRGGTVGMLIGRMTVKTLADGEEATPAAAARRAALPIVAYAASFVLPILGILYLAVYLSPILDSNGLIRGWHDKYADTVVVRTR